MASNAALAQPTASPALLAAAPVGDAPRAWAALSRENRRALAPLASNWSRLSDAQRRKWLALAHNFGSLSPAEQATLQARMSEWIALSPQQRAQARLNFGEARQLPADERKAKWEAYQALPPDEKRRLAETARPRTPGTASPVRPVPADKLVTVPRAAAPSGKPARIVTLPAPEPALPPPPQPAPPQSAPAVEPQHDPE
ncbi:DUF3106 domain-containing protein [Ramlibacter rhizophilus]|uniref:DUF3106 domain-containing protein n=1 Tax=Ramlibacter rhizophilus TaxID=1781167 RepID=A0A4Z0C3D9_9BURK|nr:DUF3106 domain-containing protein [Ramlibacter rhizophilus]TFZ04719.1 DUF3106 domain-containing protein [Ramlibacter rhizophilus]